MNEADGQLQAAHVILGYTPLSLAFQALKYVIKARDPQLHRISVAYQGFIVPEGVPIPKGTPRTQPLFVATPSIGASSSQPILEEREERKEEEEGSKDIVNLTDSSDEFEVFNQPPSLENVSEEMGIQRKPQKSLMELIEDQPRKGALGKPIQTKLPPPPPKSPLPPPQPSLPSKPKPVDPKRKREQKGKDVVEPRRSRPTREDEAHRATKQQKVSHASQGGMERANTQPPEPQAWLPTPMHGGEHLRDDASLRDFNGGIGSHVASTVEEALLLSKDMSKLRSMRKNEVFLNCKRYLGMVKCQSFFSFPPFF